MSICVPAKGGNMSNDLLHADGLGKNDVCTDGIIFLGVWDENVLHSNVKGSVLSDDLNNKYSIIIINTMFPVLFKTDTGYFLKF